MAKSPKKFEFPCLVINQGSHQVISFKINAKLLWSLVKINKRISDKNKGYQRTLSNSRVEKIAEFISKDNPIPTSILIALDKDCKVSLDGNKLMIPNKPDAGWVIDGQHRLAGAYNASTEIELSVTAFMNIPLIEQIKLFVTVNKEAKGVPTSLYLDLLKNLPHKKSDQENAKERAADIANELKKNELSPFYGKIVVMSSPRKGEISLNNFVRKVAPQIQNKIGKFQLYTVNEQIGIYDNYFIALKNIFPDNIMGTEPIFFQTLGFGALINVLPTVFDICIKNFKTFKVEDISKVLRKVDDFAFDEWKQMGTGTQAESQAGEDLRSTILLRFSDTGGTTSLEL